MLNRFLKPYSATNKYKERSIFKLCRGLRTTLWLRTGLFLLGMKGLAAPAAKMYFALSSQHPTMHRFKLSKEFKTKTQGGPS